MFDVHLTTIQVIDIENNKVVIDSTFGAKEYVLDKISAITIKGRNVDNFYASATNTLSCHRPDGKFISEMFLLHNQRHGCNRN